MPEMSLVTLVEMLLWMLLVTKVQKKSMLTKRLNMDSNNNQPGGMYYYERVLLKSIKAILSNLNVTFIL